MFVISSWIWVNTSYQPTIKSMVTVDYPNPSIVLSLTHTHTRQTSVHRLLACRSAIALAWTALCFHSEIGACWFACTHRQLDFVLELFLVVPPLGCFVEISIFDVVFIKVLLAGYSPRWSQIFTLSEETGGCHPIIENAFGCPGRFLVNL